MQHPRGHPDTLGHSTPGVISTPKVILPHPFPLTPDHKGGLNWTFFTLNSGVEAEIDIIEYQNTS